MAGSAGHRSRPPVVVTIALARLGLDLRPGLVGAPGEAHVVGPVVGQPDDPAVVGRRPVDVVDLEALETEHARAERPAQPVGRRRTRSHRGRRRWRPSRGGCPPRADATARATARVGGGAVPGTAQGRVLTCAHECAHEPDAPRGPGRRRSMSWPVRVAAAATSPKPWRARSGATADTQAVDETIRRCSRRGLSALVHARRIGRRLGSRTVVRERDTIPGPEDRDVPDTCSTRRS